MRENTLEFRGARAQQLPRRNRTYGTGRTCSQPGCATKLSMYNRAEFCWQHETPRQYVPRGKRKSRKAA